MINYNPPKIEIVDNDIVKILTTDETGKYVTIRLSAVTAKYFADRLIENSNRALKNKEKFEEARKANGIIK